MDKDAYRHSLLAILRAHSAQARAALRAGGGTVAGRARNPGRRAQVGAHPNQEQDGLFVPLVHSDGPDLHVLNKAIAPHRRLFEFGYDNGHLAPELALFDPQDPGPPFAVDDAIVGIVLDGLPALWRGLGGVGAALPAETIAGDGHGPGSIRPLRP